MYGEEKPPKNLVGTNDKELVGYVAVVETDTGGTVGLESVTSVDSALAVGCHDTTNIVADMSTTGTGGARPLAAAAGKV